MKRLLNAILISISMLGLLIFINSKMSVTCLELSVFKGDSLFQFLSVLKLLGIMIAIWSAGMILFFSWKKIQRINFFTYFTILSLISAFPIIKSIYYNISDNNEDIKNQICIKANDDGMICTMTSLTLKEYNFIIEDSPWIPKIPYSTNDISINYYRDDFLGDYDLTIKIIVMEARNINPKEYPRWVLVKKNKNNTAIYSYNEGQS